MSKMKLIMESWRHFLKEDMTEEAAAQWIADQLVPLIDQSNASTYKENLGKLVAALNSPEGQDSEVRKLLLKGDEDKEPHDEDIVVLENQKPKQGLLRPTQGVIDIKKSAGFNGGSPEGLEGVLGGTSPAPPILVCGDPGKLMFIVDGHHRWSGAAVYNLNVRIPCDIIKVDPYKALLISQMAIAGVVPGDLPQATATAGTSIIGPAGGDNARMSPQAILSFLLKATGINPKTMKQEGEPVRLDDAKNRETGEYKTGPFLNPEVLEVCRRYKFGFDELEGQEADDTALKIAVCKKVAKNCARIGEEYDQVAPEREIMPQFDPDLSPKAGPDFDAEPKQAFKTGKVNFQGSVKK